MQNLTVSNSNYISCYIFSFETLLFSLEIFFSDSEFKNQIQICSYRFILNVKCSIVQQYPWGRCRSRSPNWIFLGAKLFESTSKGNVFKPNRASYINHNFCILSCLALRGLPEWVIFICAIFKDVFCFVFIIILITFDNGFWFLTKDYTEVSIWKLLFL